MAQPEISTVTIPTNNDAGAVRVSQHGVAKSAEAPEVADARRGGKIVGMPGLATQTLQLGKRTLSDAARERVAQITAQRQTAEAAKLAPAPKADPAAPIAKVIDPRAGAARPAASPKPSQTEQLSEGEDDDEDAPAGTVKPRPIAKPAQPAAAAAPAAPDELVEARTVIDRQTKLLEQRRLELEQSGKSRDASHVTRAQQLRDAEDSYVADPTAALRKFVAGANGLKTEPEIDAEIDDLLNDLTSKRMSVPLDTAQQAKRTATLTQRAWEIDKQRRNAKEQDADSQRTQTEQASKTEAVQRTISESLGTRKDQYPNLQMAQLLDGKRPEQAVWQAIQQGIANGHLDANDPDEKLIAKAASVVEKYYQARAESLRTALNPGTADPNAPPALQADGPNGVVKKETSRQGHGPRTLTTADASVAPATTDQPPAVEARPKFKNDAERRQYVIRKNFPNHPAGKAR